LTPSPFGGRLERIIKQYSVNRKKMADDVENNVSQGISALEFFPKPLNYDDSREPDERKQQEIKMRGACVRTRFLFLHDFNTPTPYFFNFENWCFKIVISNMKTDSGEFVIDDDSIKGMAIEFYSTFFQGAHLMFSILLYRTMSFPYLVNVQLLHLSFLKTWRPVSLLCCDYKLFTKCLSNRLKHCLPDIIHPDQSYMVSNR
jgi:hypothetical protein